MRTWMRWGLVLSVLGNIAVAVALARGNLGVPETERAARAELQLHSICMTGKEQLEEDVRRFDQALALGQQAALDAARRATNSYTPALRRACTATTDSRTRGEWDEKHFQIMNRYTAAQDPIAARAALVQMRDLFGELRHLPKSRR